MKYHMAVKPSLKALNVVITGGASEFGIACAKRLLKNGSNVILSDIKKPSENITSDNCRYYEADVTKEDQMEFVFDEATKHFSEVDAVVNCAGFSTTRAIFNATHNTPHSLVALQNCLSVNVLGTFNVARLAALCMTKTKNKSSDNTDIPQRGVIINVASTSAFDGQISTVAYSASKMAVVSMTLPLARDLAPLGIRVVTIAPGLFDSTTINYRRLPKQFQNLMVNYNLFPNRMGLPGDFAEAVLFAIENTYLNGVTFRLDAAGRYVFV